MNVFVIKGKLLFAVCIAALAVGIIFGGGSAVGVFKAGNRDLPLYSVERDDNKISLTFNCAWGNEDIDSILETLNKYNCKCTFFLVGEWAEKYPDSVRKIKENGHEIGTHSYSHRDYTKITSAELGEDIEKCDNIIKGITGEAPKLVRTPSGAYNNSVVKAVEALDKICVQWSRDSVDYNKASADDIYRRSVEKTLAGDIILMHTGTENTATALPRVLDSLLGRFELVTVSELMYTENYYVDNTGRMFSKGIDK